MLILWLTITSLHPLFKLIYLGALSTHHCLIARLLLPQLLLHLLHYLKHFFIWLRPWGWRLIINIHSICISFSRFPCQILAVPASCWCRHLSFSWWHNAYYCWSDATRHGSIIVYLVYSARFILYGSGPPRLGTDRLYGFLCLARRASNCLANFQIRQRSEVNIRRVFDQMDKGKTLLLITNLMKLGLLLSILIAYCCRNRGRGLITFWNGSVCDWLGGLSGDR